MTYLRNNIWNKRLPKGMGILVLLFSLGSIFWLSRNAVLLGSKAAVGNIPKDVQISNIGKDSITVSYTTDESVGGSLSYGIDQKTGKVGFDKRDINSPLPHNIHYIILKNLSPSTKYYFTVLSGDKVFKNGDSFYEATTASGSDASSQIKISGTVKLDGGSTPAESIAYISAEGSQLLSALVQPDGSYSLSFGTFRKKDLTDFVTLAPDSKLQVKIVDQTLQSNISVLANLANPVPPVILSKNYDFSIGNNPLADLSGAAATESGQITGFPTPDQSKTASGPQITTPSSSQEFKDQQPVFEGTALPGNDVEISIQSSNEITTTVQADRNGNWQYRPDTKLTPGQHTLTIKTLDTSGIVKTITRSFTVFAEGSQFVEPSVSPTDIPTPTTILSPTPIPTDIPTITPTIAPTITPTSIPSDAPTPVVIITTPTISTPVVSPSPNITTPPIPDSGSSVLTFGLIGTVLSVGIGGLIFLLI